MDEITIGLKERFCKDNNLNIKLFKEPFFTERLNLYDKQFNTLKKWDLFLNEIAEFETEQDYFDYYNKVKDNVMNFIKENESYQDFISCKMDKYRVEQKGIPSSSIFKETSSGKDFISIDLKKGCYSALRYFNKELVANTNSYEEFIGKFTDKTHIINSKYIRQVIFGNCNPKRQTTIEKYMMDKIMKELLPLDLKFVSYTDDEIVIEFDKNAKEKFDDIKLAVYIVTEKEDFEVHFEVFNVEKIKESEVYIKKFLDKSGIDIKCANHLMMPFVLRQLNDEKPNFSDFCYFDNGNLSVLVEVKNLQIENEFLSDFFKFYKETQVKINDIEKNINEIR